MHVLCRVKELKSNALPQVLPSEGAAQAAGGVDPMAAGRLSPVENDLQYLHRSLQRVRTLLCTVLYSTQCL